MVTQLEITEKKKEIAEAQIRDRRYQHLEQNIRSTDNFSLHMC